MIAEEFTIEGAENTDKIIGVGVGIGIGIESLHRKNAVNAA